MTLLVTGLVVFLGIHLLPMVQPVRANLRASWGEGRYKIAFSIVSAIGLGLIIAGWWLSGPGPRLFPPSSLAVAVAPYVMVVVFILLASSHSPSHVRAAVKHPMLVAVILWSLVHLFANGDARGTILFGAFLAYAVVDLVSAVRRNAVATFVPRARADVISIAAGTIVALLVMTFHRILFGHAVVPFSV